MHSDTWYGGKLSVFKMGYTFYAMKLAFKRCITGQAVRYRRGASPVRVGGGYPGLVKDRHLNDLILSAREEETMEPFQPKLILCPTDFSEPATLALYYEKKMADCFGGRLIVLMRTPSLHHPFYVGVSR